MEDTENPENQLLEIKALMHEMYLPILCFDLKTYSIRHLDMILPEKRQEVLDNLKITYEKLYKTPWHYEVD